LPKASVVAVLRPPESKAYLVILFKESVSETTCPAASKAVVELAPSG
jgi:hypothetical protein